MWFFYFIDFLLFLEFLKKASLAVLSFVVVLWYYNAILEIFQFFISTFLLKVFML